MVVVANILMLLRALFVSVDELGGRNLAAYIVPAADAHNSEYVASCDDRRAYITKFDGSAGTAVVTQNYALLWTDSRYFIQAEKQMNGTEWILMRQGEANVPSLSAWLVQNLTRGDIVGVDPSLYSKTAWDSLYNELRVNGLELFPLETNLVDRVWGTERPECSKAPVTELPLEFAGKSVEEKLTDIRVQMSRNGVDILVISELDEVAWLLNLRGADIDYNPFFFAYVIIFKESFEVFIDPLKVADISTYLSSINGSMSPYENVADRLQEHATNASITGKIWLSKNCNYKLVNRIPASENDRLFIRLTPIALMKAIKNDIETQGMINSHVRDGAAVVEYFAWLEAEMARGAEITEISGADKLAEFRAQGENFVGLSFGSISASGENAALPHYSPTPESDRRLNVSEIYLLDSGGQYLDGTTDVTRTIFFGEPSLEIKNAFTRVLKGVISLRTAIFPKGSPGSRLDTLARKSLWDVMLDFGHGTGHGIGAYGGVHEGPFSIGGRTGADDPGLDVNMFMSDEPGYYKEGDFGIRTENIIRVISAGGDGSFITFDDVTLVPIQTKLINFDLLTDDELDYLNSYHSRVRSTLDKHMRENNGTYLALAYLERETVPVYKAAYDNLLIV